MGAGRPMNFDLRDFSGAEAEVQALVARGNVASGGGRESYLAIHQHARAKPIAIAACSTQGDGKPMPRAAMIHKHERLSAKRGNHNIHPAIVIQIAEGSAAAGDRRSDSGVGALE